MTRQLLRLLLTGLWLAAEAAVLPSVERPGQAQNTRGQYSTNNWPGILDSSLALDDFLESWTVGANGSLKTTGLVNFFSTHDNGLLITALAEDLAAFNYTIPANRATLSTGFGGAACLTYTIQASSASIGVTIQDEQNFVIEKTSNGSLASIQTDCSLGICGSTGMLVLNDTSGTYFFSMTNTASSIGWAAVSYTLQAAAGSVCQSASQQVTMPLTKRPDLPGSLAIGILNQPTMVYFNQYTSQASRSYVGRLCNVSCFSASMQTFTPNGLPATNMMLSVYNFTNFQNYLAGSRAVPLAICQAGARNYNQTCHIPKTASGDPDIFLVASYDPLVSLPNNGKPRVDYIFEILTAAFDAGSTECQTASDLLTPQPASSLPPSSDSTAPAPASSLGLALPPSSGSSSMAGLSVSSLSSAPQAVLG